MDIRYTIKHHHYNAEDNGNHQQNIKDFTTPCFCIKYDVVQFHYCCHDTKIRK